MVYITTSEPWTGTFISTSTVPHSGTIPGSIIVQTPIVYVSTTEPWTGTTTYTTSIDPSGTVPGTIIIRTPFSYTRTTQPWTGTIDSTTTVAPSGTIPGTVIVLTPIPLSLTFNKPSYCDSLCSFGSSNAFVSASRAGVAVAGVLITITIPSGFTFSGGSGTFSGSSNAQGVLSIPSFTIPCNSCNMTIISFTITAIAAGASQATAQVESGNLLSFTILSNHTIRITENSNCNYAGSLYAYYALFKYPICTSGFTINEGKASAKMIISCPCSANYSTFAVETALDNLFIPAHSSIYIPFRMATLCQPGGSPISPVYGSLTLGAPYIYPVLANIFIADQSINRLTGPHDSSYFLDYPTGSNEVTFYRTTPASSQLMQCLPGALEDED
ncbi:hypothetical protein RJ55_10029 [Drechmeria coniospora]|nr:hypothetical protein RJ55_10029 [Drechmeria coniospora]